jgi:hypothetical protein
MRTYFFTNEKKNSWRSSGVITGPFLPNCPPKKMDNNNFIMAGRMAAKLGETPTIPAVAISHGDKLTEKWDVIPLNYNGKLYIVYTSGKHHCCLTIIPVSSLVID